MNSGMEGQLQSFIREHSHDGVLLDAYVLLLLWAYRFDPQLIGGKKLEKYTPEDAHLLENLVSRFRRVLTTSSILTEVSNLAGLMLSGKKRRSCLRSCMRFSMGLALMACVIAHCMALSCLQKLLCNWATQMPASSL
jgi:hypothetical protein